MRLARTSVAALVTFLGLGQAAWALGGDFGSDVLRSGGSSAAFGANLQAALDQCAVVKEFVRGCATGGTIPSNNACDGGLTGGTGGSLMDFVEMKCDLKSGVGGATDVVIRVSANGSGNGARCANNVSPQPIGFLSAEGLNGVAGDGDDAVAGGDAGTDGILGTADDKAPALTDCNPGIPTTLPAGTALSSSIVKKCVVMWDRNSSKGINGDQLGIVPGSRVTVGDVATANDTNESFTLQIPCDFGFSDVPLKDFSQSSLNTQTYDGDPGDNTVFGAQMIKLIASKDTHSNAGATVKVPMNMPQIQGLLAAPGTNAICNWADLGATATSTGNAVTACIRNIGSGTKEVTRLTFLAGTGGSKTEATAGSAACLQSLEGGGNRLTTKVVISQPGTADVENCVETTKGSFGYVDLADQSANNAWYGVPIEGIDPDSNLANMKALVKCGAWRFWGPISGGRNTTTRALNSLLTNFKASMRSVSVQAPIASFVPLSGVALQKASTDNQYNEIFAPVGCPAIIPPSAIP